MNSDSRQLSRAVANLSRMTLGRAVTQVVLVISAVVIPRTLGTEAFGRYAALVAVVVILEAVASGGFHMAEIRFLAPLWHQRRVEEAVALGSSIWTVRLVLSVVGGAVAAVWVAASPALGAGRALVAVVALAVVARSGLEATRQLFLSLDRVGHMVAFEAARAVVLVVAAVVAFGTWGLTGVFAVVAAAVAALAVDAWRRLRSIAPFSPRRFRWSAVRPVMGFSAMTMVGVTAWIVQAHLPVYLIAREASLVDAAVVGVTVQVYVMAQALLIAPWSALHPILAEIESSGDSSRLREWGGVMVRWGTALSVAAALTWAFLGDLALTVLPDDFSDVHESGTIVLVAVALLGAAVSLNTLVYVGGRSVAGSASAVVFSLVTVAGTLLVVSRANGAIAPAVAWVYVGASATYFACTYATLVCLRGMWLPLRRTLLLLAPASIAWPVLDWDASAIVRAPALIATLVVYGLVARGAGLLPRAEVERVLARLSPSEPRLDAA